MISVDMIGLWYPITIVGACDEPPRLYRRIERCHDLSNYAGYAVQLSDALYAEDKTTPVPMVIPDSPKFVPNVPLMLIPYLEAKKLFDASQVIE